MTSLYKLSGELVALSSHMDDGEFDQESLELALTCLRGELQDKCINVAKYSENLASDALQIDEAIKQMQARKKSIQARSDAMKKYLFDNMVAADITKIECPYFALSIRNNPTKVEVNDFLKVPDEFKKTVETVTVDKKSIKEAGGCPGAELISTKRLQIK